MTADLVAEALRKARAVMADDRSGPTVDDTPPSTPHRPAKALKTTAALRPRSRKPRLSSVYEFGDAQHVEAPPKPVAPERVVMRRKHPLPRETGYTYEPGDELVPAQYRELCRGPQTHPGFRSDADRRQAWRDHRARILQDFAVLGITDRRPWAQDHYEAGQ